MVKKGLQTSGFTMVEILIVLAITGILVVLLRTSLNLARSEAIKRNNDVTICLKKVDKDTGKITCHAEDHDRAHWGKDGWVIFEDKDGDGIVDDGEILRVHAKLPEKETTLTFSESTRITFANSGLARSGAGAGTLFTLCDSRGADYAKGIIIGPTGRPRATGIKTGPTGIKEKVVASDDDLECPL